MIAIGDKTLRRSGDQLDDKATNHNTGLACAEKSWDFLKYLLMNFTLKNEVPKLNTQSTEIA